MRRLKERQLPLQYVREYYLLQDLSPWRRQYLDQVLRQPLPEVNTDLNPRCYFFDLALTTVQEGLGVKEALLAVQNLPPAVPWAALILATVLTGGAPPPPRSPVPVPGGGDGSGDHGPGNPGARLVPDQTGFPLPAVGAAHCGLHGGMAAGSAAGSRWTGRARGGLRLLAGLQGAWRSWPVSLAPLVARGCQRWGRAGRSSGPGGDTS